MPVLTGPLDALAVVLFVAGIAKLARPDATVPALRAVWLPASALVVRLVGVLEVVAAATVLAFGGPVGAAAACVLYAAFAASPRRCCGLRAATPRVAASARHRRR
ncbi:MAG: hypothetical protein R2690_10925 [Acidimicrobiales bacterium]